MQSNQIEKYYYVDISVVDNIAIGSGFYLKSGEKILNKTINLFYYSKIFRLDLCEIWLLNKKKIMQYYDKYCSGVNRNELANDLRNGNNCHSIFLHPYVFSFVLTHVYNENYVDLPEELEHLYYEFEYLKQINVIQQK